MLEHNSRLIKDDNRVRRGDPDSPTISYFRFECFEGIVSTLRYRAIVCPAIVQGSSGFWEPWQQGLPVVSYPFPSVEAQILLTQLITELSSICLAELPMDLFDGRD